MTKAKKMKPPHREISEAKTQKWNGEGKYIFCEIFARANTRVGQDEVPLHFSLTNEYKGFGENIDGKYEEQMSISIPDDCILNFKIGQDDGQPAFIKFSDEYDSITGKNFSNQDVYYHWWDEVSSSLRVTARSSTIIDKFNFNIEIYQGVGKNVETGGTEPIWLPASLDPDIINPKPPGFNIAAAKTIEVEFQVGEEQKAMPAIFA